MGSNSSVTINEELYLMLMQHCVSKRADLQTYNVMRC